MDKHTGLARSIFGRDVFQLVPDKKLFFASDFHLGAPNAADSRLREKKIVRWLDEKAPQAAGFFLMGDMFDFWFEYARVIPKGFARFQGKLAELTDAGLPVVFFSGNHDMWMFRYFKEEFNIEVFHSPQVLYVNSQRLLIGHGDGLGPGDYTYKILKKIFRNPFFQSVFSSVHPSIGMGIASAWSSHSRKKSQKKREDRFLGEKEWLLHYCRKTELELHHDYYVFGHRHLPLALPIGSASAYINLGEWINYYTYGEYDGNTFHVKVYEENEKNQALRPLFAPDTVRRPAAS